MAENHIPMLEFADALALMTKLFNKKTLDVAVFVDSGWGSSPTEISIIIDGNGQGPLAYISKETYKKLLDSGAIGPNCLRTYKARKCHQFVAEGLLQECMPMMYGAARQFPKLNAEQKEAVLQMVKRYKDYGRELSWPKTKDDCYLAVLESVGVTLKFGWAIGGRYLDSIRRQRKKPASAARQLHRISSN